jgi:hypothetical protein
MRVFRHSGKKANNPEGFEEALTARCVTQKRVTV